MLGRGFWVGILVALAAGGCSYEHALGVDHYSVFNVKAPSDATVSVCHGYGCRTQTKFTFTPADVAEIKKLMAKTRKSDTPAEERRAVAYAVGWMERRVGDSIGTKDDRAGMDFAASGDPTQQDCVDEATNTTSYLTVLQNQKLLKHHAVGKPFAKENFLRGVAGWTHWTATLDENGSGKRWAVDSWIYANGENPAVVEAEKWYIASLAELPKPTR
ncbi:MAG: hypothetical protein KJZ80_02440 [Hyphomicrobiaceae bacterium]|nr:hypothetical protein [Hyphomicrobiaceae bacterium]